MHAGIEAQLGVDLAVSGVYRDHAGGATLQHAVGEAPGGRANIHTVLVPHVNVPVFQRPRQFQSATTDKRLVVTEDADGGILFDGRTRLLNLLLVDQYSASQDDRLGALPRGREPALEEQFVETRFHRARLARWRPQFEPVVMVDHRASKLECSFLNVPFRTSFGALWSRFRNSYNLTGRPSAFSTALYTLVLKTFTRC